MLFVHGALKDRNFFASLQSHSREQITMVHEDVCRVIRFHHETVKIRKHLLDSLLAFVGKEENRDRLVAERGILSDRLCDCRAAVLAVVYDELGFLKFHLNVAKPVSVDWFEPDIALIRRRD